MSTRTTGRRETLEERVSKRMFVVDEYECGKHMYYIRAEYDLLARLVRKQIRELRSLLHPGEPDDRVTGRIEALNDVLAIIKERKK